MSQIFFKKVLEFLIQILFPKSSKEYMLAKMNGVFPLHINNHLLVLDSKKRIEITALSDYSDKRISALIHSLKYFRNKNSIDMISKVLGEYLLEMAANHIIMTPGKKLYIIPIPLSRKRLGERGFNQVEILLREVVKRHPDLKGYVKTSLLFKQRETKSQTTLNRSERLLNVKDSFSINSKQEYILENIIIVDDVLTTGATVLEASKVLFKAGVNKVQVVTIARAL